MIAAAAVVAAAGVALALLAWTDYRRLCRRFKGRVIR